MYLLIALLSSFCFSAQQEMIIKGDKFFAPQELGITHIIHNNQGFHVHDKDENVFTIKNCWTDSHLRNISPSLLSKFLQSGYLDIKQLDNKEFVLRAKTRGLGGGPIVGYYAYLATKALWYGAAIAVVGTATATTGGVAGAAMGAAVAGGTAGASTGAAVVAGAIAGSGTLTAAGATAAAGTALAATGGSVATAVAVVEGSSATVGGIVAMLTPFLP